MTDEHLMRHWTDAHSDFSGDLDRGLLRLGRFVAKRLDARSANSRTYAPSTRPSADNGPVARAALAGAMACLATTFLLLSMALAATAGTHAASGLAVVDHVILA